MAILYNLVRVYTTTVGTGQLTLGSAVPGHLTFSEGGVQNGDVISYSIIDGYNVEVGRGTYNAVLNVLSRDTVLNSTNSGAKISLSGNAQVMITALKQDFDHDALTNYVANEHIDHSLVDIILGSGLTGGGDLTSDINIDIDTTHAFSWSGSHTFSAAVAILSGLHIGGTSLAGEDNLIVDGDVLIGSALAVAGPSSFGLITTTGGIHIGGSTDPDAQHLVDPLYPTGNMIVEGNVAVSSSLYVEEASYFGDDLSVLGGFSIGISQDAPTGGLYVLGASLLDGKVTTGANMSVGGGLRVGDALEAPDDALSVVGRLGVGTIAPTSKVHIVGGSLRIEPNYTEGQRNIVINVADNPIQNYAGQAIRLGIAGVPSRQVELRSGSLSDYGKSPFFAVAVGAAFDDTLPVERLRITENGYVGIGTSVPTTRLTIQGSSYRDFLRFTYEGVSQYWDLSPTSSGQFRFFSTQRDASVLTLGTSNIGIGTDSPAYPLDLVGNMQIQGSALYFNQSAQVATSSGALTLAAASDIYLTASGNKRIHVGANNRLQSTNYASGTTGWGINYSGDADFRKVVADELQVETFISSQQQVVAGSQIITTSSAPLAAAFTVPNPGVTVNMIVSGFESSPSFPVFGDGDFVRIKILSRIGASIYVSDCWGQVSVLAGGVDAATNQQTYSFTRSANAENAGSLSAGTVVGKGTLVLDYGMSGSGYIESTAVD